MTEEEYDKVVLDADELEAEINAIVKESNFGWLPVFIASINSAIDSLASSGASDEDIKILVDEAHESLKVMYQGTEYKGENGVLH